MKPKKLASGNYRVQLIVGKDENGKRIVKSFTAESEWQAMKMAEDYKKLNVDIQPAKISVREAINAYIDSKRYVIAPIQRAINIDADQGMSYKTIKSAYALIRSAALLFEVELPSIRKLRLPPKTVKDELPPLDKVLNVIIGSSVELPCLLSVWCGGMRISEVRGLKYSDIYEEDGSRYIRVRRARVCINGHDVVENRNKTEQSTRDIPIPDYIYNLIQQIPHKNEDDFIISDNYGALKRRYDRLLKKHGLKMTFHDLRAQFATTMNGLGVEKEVLEKLGGWANSKVLDSVYIRTPKQRIRDSLKVFDDYMYGVIRDTRTKKTGDVA